jgi:hypothetical protein
MLSRASHIDHLVNLAVKSFSEVTQIGNWDAKQGFVQLIKNRE